MSFFVYLTSNIPEPIELVGNCGLDILQRRYFASLESLVVLEPHEL